MTKPLRVAIIGMGGFAGAHHDAVAQLEASGEYRVVAACDPAMDRFAERQQTLRFTERGVRLFTDYLTMLDACRADLDLVTIPTPIPLHAPMLGRQERAPGIPQASWPLDRMQTAWRRKGGQTFERQAFDVPAELCHFPQRRPASPTTWLFRHATPSSCSQ